MVDRRAIMKISAEIRKIGLANGIAAEELSDEDTKKIKNNIALKYTHLQPGPFLWDRLKDAAIREDRGGWEKICDFVGNSKCLIFFDDVEDKSVLVINNGKNLHKLLNEMYGFEFYVTDFETDYLLCFNHHDCLLACGAAKNWAESL